MTEFLVEDSAVAASPSGVTADNHSMETAGVFCKAVTVPEQHVSHRSGAVPAGVAQQEIRMDGQKQTAADSVSSSGRLGMTAGEATAA